MCNRTSWMRHLAQARNPYPPIVVIDSGLARSLSSGGAERRPIGAPRDDISLLIFIDIEPRRVRERRIPRPLRTTTEEITPMKIALLVVLGLVLGALGGAALGVGAGLAWVEIFKTTGFEGYSGMLVFFTFMPLGAGIGGLGGALLFGVIAVRDAEIAIERDPARRRDS